MANATGIRAGKAYVEAGLDDSGLTAGLRAAEAKLKAWGQSITAIGAGLSGLSGAALGGFFASAKQFADFGSELNDMSARTGVSVEALSILGHAAQQTGTDLGTVEAGVRKMQKNLVAARMGSDQATVAFGALGLSVENLSRLSPEDQFAAVTKAIGKVPDPTNRTAAAMALLGKSGTALLPMIASMDDLTQEAKDLGLVMSSADAESADALGDALDNLTASLGGVVRSIGSAVAPALTELVGDLTRGVAAVAAWVKQNQPLVLTAAKVAVGLAAAGAALTAFGVAVTLAGATLGGIATVITTVGAAVGALLSPIALVSIGLAAGVGAFFKYTAAGAATLGWLGKQFGTLADTAGAAWKGMGDALMAGDLALAGRVLWAALEVEWLRGTAALTAIWADWGSASLDVVTNLQSGIAGTITDLASGVQVIWAQLTTAMQGSWGDLLKYVLTSLNPVAQALKALGVDVEGVVDRGLRAVGFEPTAANEQAQQNAIAPIGQSNIDQRQALDDQRQAEIDARRKANEDAAAAAQKRLDDAMAKFQATRDAAASKAKDATAKGGKGPAVINLEDLAPAVQQAASKTDVAGTFNAAAVRGLGVGDSLQGDQLKEAKKQTEALKKIDKNTAEGMAVYAS